MGITQQAMDAFHRNGWLVVEDVLSSDEVAALHQRAEEIILGEKFPEISARCIQIEPDAQEQIESGEVSRLDAVRTLRGVVRMGRHGRAAGAAAGDLPSSLQRHAHGSLGGP